MHLSMYLNTYTFGAPLTQCLYYLGLEIRNLYQKPSWEAVSLLRWLLYLFFLTYKWYSCKGSCVDVNHSNRTVSPPFLFQNYLQTQVTWEHCVTGRASASCLARKVHFGQTSLLQLVWLGYTLDNQLWNMSVSGQTTWEAGVYSGSFLVQMKKPRTRGD